MADLIDRQAAIAALEKEGMITAMIVIDRLPAVSVADLIDRRALYEKAAALESEALRMVQKYMHSEDPACVEQWKKWSVILHERTAFRYDVFDAPLAVQMKTK